MKVFFILLLAMVLFAPMAHAQQTVTITIPADWVQPVLDAVKFVYISDWNKHDMDNAGPLKKKKFVEYKFRQILAEWVQKFEYRSRRLQVEPIPVPEIFPDAEIPAIIE